MGIELVDAHSSMADVEATNGLFTIFCNRMRCGASEGENTGLIKQAEKQGYISKYDRRDRDI